MLDKRKQKILKAVVFRYIMTGTPVGSKALAESLNLGLSAATIRNELSKLEDMGYLYQPHVSAGRVPTDLGYRFYVDSLAGRTRLGKEEREAILALFSSKTQELERLLKETTFLLSRLTSAAALVIAPRLERTTIKHVDLVRLNEDHVLLVIITNTGRVEKKTLYLREREGEKTTEKAQELLNRHLQGKGLEDIEETDWEEELGRKRASLPALRAVEAVKEILTREEYEKIYVGGAVNLLRDMKEEGIARIEGLLKRFEEQYYLLNMLREVIRSRKMVVRIGDENILKELQDFSLVATPYGIGEELVGTVSVLGPTRMNYARVIPTVDFIASSLSRALENLTG
jgi:heat-inducible transcriptional repressor